jgi:AcrR family transcriptional regulator
MPPAVVRARRTQKERRDETRRAVLDATVACLTELGYAGTSTIEVQRRAEVSRGALLHHFPSKAGLMVEAVRHLAWLRGRDLRRRMGDLPERGDRIGAAIDLLWECFSGPLFYVTMELRTAARSDAELRAPLAEAEREVRGFIGMQFREVFGARVADKPGFEDALDTTIQFMIGAAMTRLLHNDPERVAALMARWKRIFPVLIEQRG